MLGLTHGVPLLVVASSAGEYFKTKDLNLLRSKVKSCQASILCTLAPTPPRYFFSLSSSSDSSA